jgi:hypothetical protein
MKWFWFTLVLFVALAVFACGNNSETYNNEYENYNDDYAYNEGVNNTGEYALYDDEAYADEYYMSPEDCYDDEEYDEADQMCYPIYDDECADDECEAIDEEFYTLVDDLLGVFLSGEEEFSEEGFNTSEDAIITYVIQGNKIVNPQPAAITSNLQAYQDDAAAHQRIWVLFANLIPAEHRTYFSKYVIFTDGTDEVLAAVEPDPDNPRRWILSVDIADAANEDELIYTLVHEFAHVLTLNESQVPFDNEVFAQPDNEDLYQEAEASCPTFFPGEGCSLSDSYINVFFDTFWGDIYEDWLESDPDSDEFYQMYEDQFVTDYAATNPAEDIAETFMAFVLEPKPNGNTIAEEKVLFFYQYPELVQLRAEIAGRTYARLRR